MASTLKGPLASRVALDAGCKKLLIEEKHLDATADIAATARQQRTSFE